ncbi:MAG: spore coat protein CotJB [Sporolactobacillus sp.]
MVAQKALPPDYYKDLQALQAIDFTVVELNLYLDTHPDDLDALKQFNSAALKSHELRTDFEKKYGPLQGFGNSFSAFPWQWVEAPWPWQV